MSKVCILCGRKFKFDIVNGICESCKILHERPIRDVEEECALELGEWFLKWSQNKLISVETLLGMMETYKFTYLMTAWKQARKKDKV